MLLALGMFGTGAAGSVGYQAYAQTSTVADSTELPSRTNENFWTDDHMDDVEPTLPQGGITEAQAREIITSTHPAVSIRKMELEDEDGALMYSADLSDRTEVMVNALTGEIALDSEESDDRNGRDTDDE